MSLVPDHYRGVWARRLLETPDLRDDNTDVRWLQCSLWHADLRVPSLAPEADAILGLSSQQGFCGVTEVAQTPQGEVCTWRRQLDFQPPRAQVDAGLMVFDTPDRVIETGIHANYLEVWERLPESTGHFIALAGLDAAGHETQERFLVAGRYAMRIRPRRCPLPLDTPAGQSLAEVLALHPEQTADLLDFEISFGTLEDSQWTIEQSTLPVLRGAHMALSIQKLDSSRACMASAFGESDWRILEWTEILPDR